MLSSVVDGIKTAIGFILLILAVIGAIALWKWVFGDDIKEDTASVILKAERRNALVTGYAFISVLRFNESKSGPVVEDWTFGPLGQSMKGPLTAKDVEGMCHRLYKVTFGFSDLAAVSETLNASPAAGTRPAPSVMGIEAIEAYSRGKAMTDAACDGFDVVPRDAQVDQRLQPIMRRMVIDQLLESQYEQGCQLLELYRFPPPTDSRSTPTGDRPVITRDDCQLIAKAQSELEAARVRKEMLTLLRPAKSSTAPVAAAALAEVARASALDNAVEKWLGSLTKGRSADQRGQSLGESTGALGSLAVTLSTVGSLAHDRGILFWKSEEFSVRRDITSALYGSAIRSSTWRTARGKLQLVVDVDEPTILSRDRRTDFSLATSGFDGSHTLRATSGGSRAEANVLDSVNALLAQIETQAIRLSRSNIRANLESQAASREATLVLSFH
jgi:hypothetical protein